MITSDFGYTTGLEEIFCVSENHANAIEVADFYAITPELNDIFPTSGFYAKLAQAAWIADHWTVYGTSDTIAQKAVWKVTDVMDRLEDDGTDLLIYNDALDHTNYLTSNWYYAHSLGSRIEYNDNYQDYLTPASPVPEPATMLLLGSGLTGLAGIGRKKFFKR